MFQGCCKHAGDSVFSVVALKFWNGDNFKRCIPRDLITAGSFNRQQRLFCFAFRTCGLHDQYFNLISTPYDIIYFKVHLEWADSFQFCIDFILICLIFHKYIFFHFLILIQFSFPTHLHFLPLLKVSSNLNYSTCKQSWGWSDFLLTCPWIQNHCEV